MTKIERNDPPEFKRNWLLRCGADYWRVNLARQTPGVKKRVERAVAAGFIKYEGDGLDGVALYRVIGDAKAAVAALGNAV